MKIEILDSYLDISREAKNFVVEGLNKKKNLLLCTATGSSPTLTYQLLADEYKDKPDLFSQFRIIKLDEWGGLTKNNPATCESYLRSRLLNPLQIPDSRYTGFESNPSNPELECKKIQEKLEQEGPIDICILGFGMNGHIAFNEPSEYLTPDCHVAKLTATSLSHPMAAELADKPTFGLTLGMADILRSKMIIILIHGSLKRNLVKKFLSKKISSLLPASFLWLHPNAICLIEKDAMEE